MSMEPAAATPDPQGGLTDIARSCYNQRAAWRKRLWRFERNPADADDILQEALLQAHLSIRHYRGESSLETWFSAVLANVARQHVAREVRRNGRMELRDDESPLNDASAAHLDDNPLANGQTAI